jgi:CRISPR-associated protein Cst2
LSRKASRFFRAGETEQANILKEFDKRGAKYFLGDDTSGEGMSVMDAYDAAYKFFDKNPLFDPTGDAETITSEQFEKEG